MTHTHYTYCPFELLKESEFAYYTHIDYLFESIYFHFDRTHRAVEKLTFWRWIQKKSSFRNEEFNEAQKLTVSMRFSQQSFCRNTIYTFLGSLIKNQWNRQYIFRNILFSILSFGHLVHRTYFALPSELCWELNKLKAGAVEFDLNFLAVKTQMWQKKVRGTNGFRANYGTFLVETRKQWTKKHFHVCTMWSHQAKTIFNQWIILFTESFSRWTGFTLICCLNYYCWKPLKLPPAISNNEVHRM